jgi:Tol biopolymer transport system component
VWALDERRSLFRQPSSIPIQLTSGPILWGAPIPGRDEKTIFVDGANPRGELSRIDQKTGSTRPFLGGISAEYVSFSPDEKFVAYVTFPEGILWRANRDGSNRLQLTRPPDHVSNPRWSPNSKEIVYITETPDGHDSIRRVSAVDGTPLWLMSEEPADMHDANWSPDGRKVLFAESPGHGFMTGKRDLRVVDLETRQASILSGSDGMWSPRWSPDGRYIAGLRGLTGNLPLFDFATKQWHTLPGGGDVEFPSFSRDSRFIYFLRHGRDQGVFRIPVAGGKVERVVNMTDWHLTGFLGYSMSLDPTDAPLVLRDIGSDDIYALTLEEK